MEKVLFENVKVNNCGVKFIIKVIERKTRYGSLRYDINEYIQHRNDAPQYNRGIGYDYKTLNIAKRYLKKYCNLTF